jgi:hypothetical protein
MPAARGIVVVGGALLCAGAGLAAPAAAVAGTSDVGAAECVRVLAAVDGGGHDLFRTVALALDRPGVAAAPLDPLERSGVRWERLEVRTEPAAGGMAVDAATVEPASNLVLLRVPGLAACDGARLAPAATAAPAETARPATGSAILVLRERHGYRSGRIGGRVDRVIALPDGHDLALAHLLDEAGADPGLVVDPAGTLLGASAPSPVGADGSLAVVALGPVTAVDPVAHGAATWRDARLAIQPRPAPSYLDTPAGLAGQALVLVGPGRADRGIALLTRALGDVGDAAALRLERGALEFAAWRLPAAIADFSDATHIDPDSHLASFNLGIALGAAGRYAEASQALRRASELRPEHPGTRYQLALALKAARRPDEARREYEALRRLDAILADDLRQALGY